MKMAEFVTPFAGEVGQEINCNSCAEPRLIGLRMREGAQFGRSVTTGFICIYCIARMWNTPTTTPHEPSAEERASNEEISETTERAEIPEEFFIGSVYVDDEVSYHVLPEMEEGQVAVIHGKRYKIIHVNEGGHFVNFEFEEIDAEG